MSNKRVAILGCGRIATKRHAPILSSGQVRGLTLTAVCDIDADKARTMGERGEVPWYTDGDVMMREVNPDILAICTPSGMHFEHAMHFLDYGKSLVIEKPLCLIATDARSLVYKAQQVDVSLFPVLQNRFNVAVQHLYRAWCAGRFGELINANVTVRWSRDASYYQDWHGTWAQAGGVLANQAIHHIDLLTWMFGMPHHAFARASRTRSGEVEDTLVGILEYYHGSGLVTLELTATAYKDMEGSLTINGTRGIAKIGGFAVNRVDFWYFDEELPEDALIRTVNENPPSVYGYGHCAFYQHVLDCLEKGVPSPIDGYDSIKLITALYQSVEEEREINLAITPYSARLGC